MKKIILVGLMAVLVTGCSGGKTGTTGSSVANKQASTLACNTKMSAYKVADTSIQFCYDKTWGEPVITQAKAKTGSAATVNFGSVDNAKAPKLWVETKDFVPAEGKKEAELVVLNAAIDDAEKLKAEVVDATGYAAKDIKARKTDVGAVRAIRADVGGKVKKVIYYIPSAFENHNVVISGSSDLAETVDNFAFDMLF